MLPVSRVPMGKKFTNSYNLLQQYDFGLDKNSLYLTSIKLPLFVHSSTSCLALFFLTFFDKKKKKRKFDSMNRLRCVKKDLE
jgi:hypothetical protein